LIDLLLPVKDGIQIIEAAKAEGYQGKFIMISQVEDENMIAKAYERGIIFFISKPINLVEVINVIKGVCHNIELERSMQLIKNAVININQKPQPLSKSVTNSDVARIFTDIGIISETGSSELMKLIHKIMEHKRVSPSEQYQLQDFYKELAEKEYSDGDAAANSKTIEQRIRRVILKALENIALLGHDDYYND
jgi:two-component system response regulator YcbB